VNDGQPLVIRADASPQIGAGHVMRTLALAQAWLARGGGATLVGAVSGGILERVRGCGVEVVAEPLDAHRLLDLLEEKGGRSWLVLDGYHFDAGYVAVVRGAGYPLLFVDDNAEWPLYEADLVLNQNVYAEGLDYRAAPHTGLLLGTRYALLRSEFLDWRGQERTFPDMGRRVLVTLGGSDPENVTERVLEGLASIPGAGLEVRAVVGHANPHLESLERFRERSGLRLELLRSVDDMPSLMAWADLAVTAGGSTAWELAYMGLPACLVTIAENQRRNVETLHERGAGIGCGWSHELEPRELGQVVGALAADPARRRAMSEIGRRLVDGRGADRVIDAMRAIAA